MKFFITLSLLLFVLNENLKKPSSEIKNKVSNSNDPILNKESNTYSKIPTITNKELNPINTNKETFFMDFFHNYNFLNKEFYEFNLNSKELKISVNNFLRKIILDSEAFMELYEEINSKLKKLKNKQNDTNNLDVSLGNQTVHKILNSSLTKDQSANITKENKAIKNNKVKNIKSNLEKIVNLNNTSINHSQKIDSNIQISNNSKNLIGMKNSTLNNEKVLNHSLKNEDKNSLKFSDHEIEHINSEVMNDLLKLILDFPKKLYLKDNQNKNSSTSNEGLNITDLNLINLNHQSINSNEISHIIFITEIIKSMKSEYERIYDLQSKLQNNTLNISNLYSSFLQNFSDFEAILKERSLINTQDKYENNHIFYNSISLILLAMLSGGMVGLIFVLTFSYKVNKDQ